MRDTAYRAIQIRENLSNMLDREPTSNLRFMLGKTQTEVANKVGISQAQVSRLEKGAIKKIRNN